MGKIDLQLDICVPKWRSMVTGEIMMNLVKFLGESGSLDPMEEAVNLIMNDYDTIKTSCVDKQWLDILYPNMGIQCMFNGNTFIIAN